ncbi:relaxase/mobilization nuclease domain-containing protein [Oceaniradius stylonematis]|uniref:relaxase/mobilization nuclease domain-containing protein n=1 Tax=Oceaniradius stylonematis TaxID=2184161 RepID=UPI00273DFCC1|nr:relaxase [Oceaniradius stylonematis]
MILHGNQRGGAKDLALHLMKDENETVQVVDVRGFISQDLMGALNESYAMSRATKCRQHVFSLSLNPPKGESVSDQDFLDAAELAEERLGLSKQPRIIVFHEKYGSDGQLRKHAHAVWSRIDTKSSSGRMKAVQLSYTKRKLVDVGRELYIRHGWRMPHGFIDPKRRDPKNFTLAEWQQAKRQGRDAKTLKAMFQERWAISDSVGGFAHALEEQGFILAKGDRRGLVAVDYKGEVYSISRWVGVKTKAVREKLGEPDALPSVQQAHAKAAAKVAKRLRELCDQQHAKAKRFDAVFARRADNQDKTRHHSQAQLDAWLYRRAQQEEAERQARIRKGILGFIDRLTGYRRKIEQRNAQERATAHARDLLEKQRLAEEFERQSANRAQAQERRQRDLSASIDELAADIAWLHKPSEIEQAHGHTDRQPNTYTPHSRDEPEPEP